MEEKERYEFQEVESSLDLNDTDIVIVDNEKGGIISYENACKLLNQQSNRIKELELLLKADKKIETNSLNGFEKLRKENQQLKQSQKQLAISELKKLLDETTLRGVNDWTTWVYCIKAQIKSLKGE